MPRRQAKFQPVATRHLSVEGSRAKIKVEIGRPYPSKRDYGCDFKISYGRKTIRESIYGVDAFQSLQLALKLLPTVLRHTAAIPFKKVYLHELGDDMGFPEVMGQ